MFNVYAIESLATKRIYIGHTKDFDERLKYHNSGYVKSTAQDRPWKVLALEKFEKKEDARWLERSPTEPTTLRPMPYAPCTLRYALSRNP